MSTADRDGWRRVRCRTTLEVIEVLLQGKKGQGKGGGRREEVSWLLRRFTTSAGQHRHAGQEAETRTAHEEDVVSGVPLDERFEVFDVLAGELLEVRDALVLLGNSVEAAGAAAEHGRLLLAKDSIEACVAEAPSVAHQTSFSTRTKATSDDGSW